MNRKTRLVALTNDALGLAAANFTLPVYKMSTVSQTTQSVSSVVRSNEWQLRTRIMSELVGLNPEEVYTTLPERLSGLPQGYSWKIAEITCLYEGPESLHILDFKRDTIHKRFSTEDRYQNYITMRMETVWVLCQEYYNEVEDVEVKSRKPSMLVLEKIDGSEELASNSEFLLNLISHLWSDNNPLSMEMYELVWKTEVQTGVWEYSRKG